MRAMIAMNVLESLPIKVVAGLHILDTYAPEQAHWVAEALANYG
eukprot:CAMPEP_0115033406 /NCGR_PEP_ID=MMETSP0216-20121206/39857_1 /TAXON_ID=223996 /ORGANISM="Protocruzia adherens, Strain Boccale" /LENGTH=43 /DNA_ID= /DNA_START= /DNA_END= /DNA_ORIENTATION=